MREVETRGEAIRRIMTAPVISVSPGTDLATTADLMLSEGIGSVLVVDDEGRLVGIVTDSDFCAREAPVPFSTFRWPRVFGHWLGEDGVERVYQEARRWKVADVMSSPVHSVGEDDSLDDLLQLMLERRVKHVPVVRDGRPVGIVARHDVLKMMLERARR